ncbi:hypothetical protein BCR44DRAFT_90272 [Catenaria anguillulae PL171]|uniref:Leucine-rich repeat-containing N-terminal plant-type domain-containing protein n=1 Tax=Catenaria anguillulae PL171 TaxID=765915 RepID=A0A1Y2H934_9FUNG|nr:hypothetical protein BCR44DRAFT_90272 [Catenaria anguillulae PL171]
MSSSNSADCGPLQELRKDLSGECCTWAGVTCDQRIGRVTAVRWSNVRLTGSIPPSIGGLTNLTDLNLSNNQLTGSIPPTIGNLKNLGSLDLGDNKLGGQIPPELGGLSSVTWLAIGGNQLTGPVPESLSQLPKLNYLYLYRNRLTGPLTKLPNPQSGCNMLSSFSESNNFGCIPRNGSGKCAADLEKNKVPECDANGNPPGGSFGSGTGGSLSPSLGNSPSTSSSGSNTPSVSDSTSDSSSSSFPTLAVVLPVGVTISVAFWWFLVVIIRRRQAQFIANHRVPITVTMPNGNTATIQVGAPTASPLAPGAAGVAGVMTQQHQQQSQVYPPEPIPMPKPTLLSTPQSPTTPVTGNQAGSGGGDWQYVKLNTIRVEQPVGDETMRRPLPAIPTAPVLKPPTAHEDDDELYLPPPAPGPRPEDDNELALPGDKPAGVSKKDRSADYRVTDVRWWGTRLTGSIPASIGGLVNLTYLYVPSECSELSSWNIITRPTSVSMHFTPFRDLSNNEVTGPIPRELAGSVLMADCRTCPRDLDFNKLNGTIPDELGSLPLLSNLDLRNNELSGRLPESLSQLKLGILYLHNNRLTGPLVKLPNPSSNCFMLVNKNMDELNDFACIPRGATGTCASDLALHNVPGCDANGNPPPGSRSGSTSLPTPTLGSSVPPPVSTTDAAASSSSFPMLAVTLPGAIMFVFVAWMVVNRGRQTTHPIAAAQAMDPKAASSAGSASATVIVEPTLPKPANLDTTKSSLDHDLPAVPTLTAPVVPTSPALQSNAIAVQDDGEELYLPPPTQGPRPDEDIELVLPGDKPIAMLTKC